MNVPTLRDGSVLLYDGLCGFCDSTVQFLLARDRHRMLRFAPLQGDYARALFERHPELRGVDSLILVQPVAASGSESIALQSDAVVQLAAYLGGGWRIAGVLLGIVPRVLRNVGYAMFARIRYRVFGTREACRLPSADERARFIA